MSVIEEEISALPSITKARKGKVDKNDVQTIFTIPTRYKESFSPLVDVSKLTQEMRRKVTVNQKALFELYALVKEIDLNEDGHSIDLDDSNKMDSEDDLLTDKSAIGDDDAKENSIVLTDDGESEKSKKSICKGEQVQVDDELDEEEMEESLEETSSSSDDDEEEFVAPSVSEYLKPLCNRSSIAKDSPKNSRFHNLVRACHKRTASQRKITTPDSFVEALIAFEEDDTGNKKSSNDRKRKRPIEDSKEDILTEILDEIKSPPEDIEKISNPLLREIVSSSGPSMSESTMFTKPHSKNRQHIMYNDCFNQAVEERYYPLALESKPHLHEDALKWAERLEMMEVPINKRHEFGIEVSFYESEDPEDLMLEKSKKYEQLKLSLKILFNTSQTVASMRKGFICENAFIPTEEIPFPSYPTEAEPTEISSLVFQSAMMIIGDTVFSDLSQPSLKNYGPLLNSWLLRQNAGKPEYMHQPLLKAKSMSETFLRDLSNIRLGAPNLYVHNGNCEHIFTINKIRHLNICDGDFPSHFPRILNLPDIKTIDCRLCSKSLARWVVMDFDDFPESPIHICKTCVLSMCFERCDNDTKWKRRGHFRLYPYYQLIYWLHHAYKISVEFNNANKLWN